MSVQPTDTSTPASYSYPSSLSATDLAVGKSAASPTTPAATDTYEKQYASFLAYNDQELIANSVASPTTSAQSTESVLEQAAADQQAGWTVASSPTSTTTPTTTTPSALDDADVTNLPTFDDIINASDATANTYIDNLVNTYGGTGTTGNTVDASA